MIKDQSQAVSWALASRYVLIASALALAVSVSPITLDAHGCDCERSGDWAEASAKAPFIIRGEFIRHEPTSSGGVAHFAVSEVIKGAVSSRRVLIAGGRGKGCSRLLNSFTLGVELLLALDRDPDAGPQAMSTCIENITRTPSVTGSSRLSGSSGLSGWPLSLLRAPQRALLELEGGPQPQKARLEVLAVREWRGFFAERPAVWLFVFKFPSQAAALNAQPELTRPWNTPHRGPFHTQSVVNGAYLLVAGLPSDKPPSQEMRAARDVFVQAFAGEE